MDYRSLILSVMLVQVSVSCESGLSSEDRQESDNVRLEVMVPPCGTKVDGTADENAVRNLQVFVFDHHGMLEAYACEDRNGVSVSCSSGEKEVVALVNTRRLDDVISLVDLENRRTYLSENAQGFFVMEGRENVTLRASTSLTVPVRRVAARVALTGISVDFELEQHDRQAFQIKAVYLLNVAGDRACLTPTRPSSWHNRIFRESGSPDVVGIDFTNTYVSEDAPYDKLHYLYCYPNPTAGDESGGVWSPRKTRLVVETELGGKTYYYPVTLDTIESNSASTVSVRITRPGSSSPDKPVDSQTASFSVSVQPWDDGIAVNERI